MSAPGGDIAACCNSAVAAPGGRSERPFSFTGTPAELAEIVNGSTLAGVIADRGFQFVEVREIP